MKEDLTFCLTPRCYNFISFFYVNEGKRGWDELKKVSVKKKILTKATEW